MFHLKLFDLEKIADLSKYWVAGSVFSNSYGDLAVIAAVKDFTKLFYEYWRFVFCHL